MLSGSRESGGVHWCGSWYPSFISYFHRRLEQSPLYLVRSRLERWAVVLSLWLVCLPKETKGWDFQPSEVRNDHLSHPEFLPCVRFSLLHCWISPRSQPPPCDRQRFFLPPLSLHEFPSIPKANSPLESFAPVPAGEARSQETHVSAHRVGNYPLCKVCPKILKNINQFTGYCSNNFFLLIH